MNLLNVAETVFWWAISPFRRRKYQSFTKLCSQTTQPDFKYIEGSWVHRKVTSDQQRIVAYLQTNVHSQMDILHVGIGSSEPAKLLHYLVKSIDGVSVVTNECEYAQSLKLPNYQVFNLSKYSDEMLKLGKQYDFIIDNNLSSYACCITHFEQMLSQYLQLLKPSGKIISDTNGLRYYMTGFGLNLNALKRWEQYLPMQISSLNYHLFVIEKR
jgi:hypothetical protein